MSRRRIDLDRAELIDDAQACPVSTLIAVLCIAFFLQRSRDPELITMRFVATGGLLWNEGEFWRLFSTVLLHADILHLAFNLYWLHYFGRRIERWAGSFLFLPCVLLLALDSVCIQIAFSGPGIGLSGVVCGLFGLELALRRSEPEVDRYFIPETARFLLFALVAMVFIDLLGIMRIGNAAHFGGLFTGILLGSALSGDRRGLAALGLAGLSAAGILLSSPGLRWELIHVLGPH